MSLNLQDCRFLGPALPEPFVAFELEAQLRKKKLLVDRRSGDVADRWESYRRKLRQLGDQGQETRVATHVFEPLVERLGYTSMEREREVITREGAENGGWVLRSPGSETVLRVWAWPTGTDLDAPNLRGRAYRFSPALVAQRVLWARGERLGLLSDGDELRLVFATPGGGDSHVAIPLGRAGGWRSQREVPDSYRLLVALARPEGVQAVPDLLDEARKGQTKVTNELRDQARTAVEGFVQEVLDHPANADVLATWEREALARELWREGLNLIYRLLFVLKLESSPDPARAFSFASTSLWRRTYSPGIALARFVRKLLDEGQETGGMLETGLRSLFRLFQHGLSSSELKVSPLGGMLFGAEAIPLLDRLTWGERAVAMLLDRLLWTPGKGKGAKAERRRVHYGSLDVEDLGRVYEALLELEPGLAAEPMCRLQRDKLQVVVPMAQGQRYRNPDTESKVKWIEEIHPGRFYLRAGLGRKSSGSYYTPREFVRFLVQETLGPQVDERSPHEDPRPGEILKLRVLDPAMGSGHFLVEACRYLGLRLYEACRLCDEKAQSQEDLADQAATEAERTEALARTEEWRRRVSDLPDPNDELVSYLPSRVTEGEETGLSQWKAEALCRRLVAVHCLYGVDKNPLAVELAKLSLWLESYSEGLPLTFLDHRLLQGDSLTGPFYQHLLTWPRAKGPIEGLFVQDLAARLTEGLNAALVHVRDLEASVGKDVEDLERKASAKDRLDQALAPFLTVAAAWSGGVMLGDEADDEAYEALLRTVAEGQEAQALLDGNARLARMVALGREGIAYDLVFPEVFWPEGRVEERGGFDAVVGNPPWDALQPLAKEFYAAFDLRVLDAPTRLEREEVETRLNRDEAVMRSFQQYVVSFEQAKRSIDRVYSWVNREAGGRPSGAVMDLWQAFAERGLANVRARGRVGWVLPSSFHANQSATGIRELYLEHNALRCCFSFENREKLFEIDSRYKFATVVAERGALTGDFPVGFYLHDMGWLFEDRSGLVFNRAFVKASSPEYLALPELQSESDLAVAKVCYERGLPYGQVAQHLRIRCGPEADMSKDAFRFTPAATVLKPGEDARDPQCAIRLLDKGYLLLHEGKTFHQYDDHWTEPPRYLVHLSAVADKSIWTGPARHYRLAFRDIAASTNERTGIFCLLAAGTLFGNTAPCERKPEQRPNAAALVVLSVVDSFSFDWNLRQKNAAHLNLFILNGIPVPPVFPGLSPEPPEHLPRFLAHSALRLTCNHSGYAALWRDQVGDAWREPVKPPLTWPVLAGDEERWAVRAAIDAVVAAAYGLTRDQYAHVLSSFNHKSYPASQALCLAAFDKLSTLGLEAFTHKYDPYWDIPLNQNLPQPVIDLPTANQPPARSAAKTPTRRAQQLTLVPPRGEQLSLLDGEDDNPPGLPLAADGPTPSYVPTSSPPRDPYNIVRYLLETKGVITSQDAQHATGLDAAAVHPHLQSLVREGLAVVEGQKRGTRYRRAVVKP